MFKALLIKRAFWCKEQVVNAIKTMYERVSTLDKTSKFGI